MRIELATVIPGNAHANSHATAAVDWPLVSDQSEVARLGEHYDALLLYGSYARGDARQDSDIDLLAIDERSLPKPKLPPQFSLTVYNQKQICSMARRGSLFLLHLRHESKILKDVYNIFPPLWENWVAPD